MIRSYPIQTWPMKHCPEWRVMAFSVEDAGADPEDTSLPLSRLVMVTDGQEVVLSLMHLPPRDDTSAWLSCVGNLCATGLAISQMTPNALRYLYPKLNEVKL